MSTTIKNIILFLSLLFFAGQSLYAQPSKIIHRDRLGDSIILRDINEDIIKRQTKPKPKLNSITFGPALYTDGIGLIINYNRSFGYENFGSGKEETYYHSHFVQLEISERYHRKEYRATAFHEIIRSLFFQESIYMYGKVNNIYNIRLNYGQKRLIGGRGEPNSPLIQYYGSIGFNAFLVKPYYLKIFGGNVIKYSEDTEREFLTKEAIEGKAGFTKGLNEIETIGAVNLRTGFYIDFSKKPNRTSAFDIGLGLDYSFSKVDQMVNMTPTQWYLNAYVSYQWGKKF